VWEPLRADWARSLPGLDERLAAAERSAAAKGWRWIGEMEEIAAAFAADGLPPGFHEAAAAVYRNG
jgi:TPP-dependent 2-oxoacid decarboxylase